MKAKGLLLATLMVFSLIPVVALAAQNGKGEAMLAQKPQWTDDFEQQKMNFEEAKEQFKIQAINQQQFRAEVKNYLGNSLGTIENVALKIRDRVKDQDFDRFLNQTRLRLQNCSSEDEMVSIAGEMKQQWNRYRAKAKSQINQQASEKMTGIILNANGLASKLNATIQKLKDQGKNTSSLEGMLAQFQEKINLAYETKLAAQEQLSNAGEDEQMQNEAHQQLQLSHQYLKQAHQILKDLVRELKNEIGTPLLQETEENESEQVSE
jgi:hypothetical protein